MKKLIYTLFFVLISVVANGQAKYVFYFIGDGMGVNQVNGTEMYQAEIQNFLGVNVKTGQRKNRVNVKT